MNDRQYSNITDWIISCFYKTYNNLGYGFLEKVYEKALMIELRKMGVTVISQSPIKVHYSDEIVGEYFCDLLVESKVIVEIKATRNLLQEHEAQLLNYLKASEVEVGLLLNFGPKPEVKRKAYSNNMK